MLNEIYEGSLLAMAGYAEFNSGATSDYKSKLTDAGMSAEQAAEFVKLWPDVRVYSSALTGLRVNVFRNSDTGKVCIAIEGSIDVVDFVVADTTIALGLKNTQYPALAEFVEGLYADGYIAPGLDQVTVAGHSLGGFLAQMLSIDMTGISHTYTYNAPGFGGLAYQIGDYFGLSGSTPNNTITNIVADGLSMVAGLGRLYGEIIEVQAESSITGVLNHSLVRVVDTLAVYNLLWQMDSTLDIERYAVYFKSASNEEETSLESLVDSLQKLFGLGSATLPTNDREAFYQALYGVQDKITAGTDASGQFTISQTAAVADARTDFGVFLSVMTLAPFILGVSSATARAKLQAENGDLYSLWSEGSDGVSDAYLADRLDMMQLMWGMNIQNLDSNEMATDLYYDDEASNTRVGSESGADRRIVYMGGDAADTFTGGDQSDHLYGGGGADVLSGNAGNDYLEGNADNDTLKSGRGFDILNGGEGNDTYDLADGNLLTNLDAVVITNDTDGGTISLLQGVTFHHVSSETAVDGVFVAVQANGEWQSGKEGWSVSVSNGQASIHLQDGSGQWHTITVDQFDFSGAKAYGLNLQGRVNAPTISSMSDWNLQTVPSNEQLSQNNNVTVYDPNKGEQIYSIESFGGDDRIVMGEDDADVSRQSWDYIDAGPGSDQIYAAGGSDVLRAMGSQFRWFDYDTEKYDSFMEALYNNASTLDGVPLAMEVSDGNIVTEKNLIRAGDGDDYVSGSGGVDVLDGGADQDRIWAGAGGDTVTGGAGRDVLYGDSYLIESDVLMADFIAPDILPDMTAGQEDYSRAYFYQNSGGGPTLRYNFNAKTHFNDVLDGGDDDDWLAGEIGNDVLSGGLGNDILLGDRTWNAGHFAPVLTSDEAKKAYQPLASQFHGNDALDGGEGLDILCGGGGDDHLVGGTGDDKLYGDVGMGLVDTAWDVAQYGAKPEGDPATAIHASSTGWWGDDYLYGGAGSDTLIGEGGKDVLMGGSENDFLYGDWKNSNDQTNPVSSSTQNGQDTLFGHEGEDYLCGGGDDDVLEGGAGNDTLYGDYNIGTGQGNGKDTLRGGQGNDYLFGGGGNDTLDGGSGNDWLEGGEGADTYIYTSAGIDTFNDSTGTSTLQLLSRPLRCTLQGAALYIEYNQDNYLIVENWQGSRINTQVNGSSYTLNITAPSSLPSGVSALSGSAGNENFQFDNDYTASFHLGNSGGEDGLVFDAGWLEDGYLSVKTDYANGNLVIEHSNNATASLTISAGLQWVSLTGVYNLAGTDTNLHITGSATQANTLTGFAGHDWISGSSVFNDTLSGGAGNDILDGLGGHDVLSGNDGNDTLTGTGTLSGGLGDDVLSTGNLASQGSVLIGGLGQDVFSLQTDGGSAEIGDDAFDGDLLKVDVTSDRIHMDNSGLRILQADANPATQSLVNATSSVLYFGAVGNAYWGTVDPENYKSVKNLSLQFADGTVWDSGQLQAQLYAGTDWMDQVMGDDTANVINGLGGADMLYGAGGNDTLHGDDGDDNLYGNDGDDILDGGAGYDYLVGGDGNDVYAVDGNSGVDTLVDDWASINTVRFAAGVAPSTVTAERSGSFEGELGHDLILRWSVNDVESTLILNQYFNVSDNSYNLPHAVRIEFCDGVNGAVNTVWQQADVDRVLFRTAAGVSNTNNIKLGDAGINTLQGNSSKNYLYGDAGNDTLNGNGGNDWLDGGTGNDTLTGGNGADVFRFGVGSGVDIISDTDSADRIQVDAGLSVRDLLLSKSSGNQLALSSRTGTDSIQFSNALSSIENAAGHDVFVKDAITIAAADSADDAAVILSAQDLLNAACGEAELSRWQMTAVEGLTADGWHNTPDDLGFYALGFAKNFWDSGQNVVGLVPQSGDTALHLTFTRDDGVVLNRMLSVHVQSGGSIWGDTGSDMIDMSQRWVDEGSEMLVIQAQGGDDQLRGSAMDDDLSGGAGDDWLTGHWGNDAVHGNEGNDTFQADWGNDVLAGDAGNDTYGVSYLWGGDQDVVDNTTAAAGDVDTIAFSHITDYRELWFAQSGTDLRITQLDQAYNGSVTVKDWYADTDSDGQLDDAGAGRVEQFTVQQDDGAAYAMTVDASFDNLLQAMATFSASNGAPVSLTSSVEALHNDNTAWLAVNA